MSAVTWSTLDWAALERLRAVFLGEARAGAPYWRSRSDLESYDFTFAQRIAWKWDAVLRELEERGWRPPAREVLDWGCGSGIAGRRVAEAFGPRAFDRLRVFDHSALAEEFAAEADRSEFPGLAVERASPAWLAGEAPVGVLVVSHVLNELADRDRLSLLRLAGRAAAVLWVEPGTYAASRALIGVREQLREGFDFVAPCTHQEPCGLLSFENERHWCHHFAPPPAGIMADSDWVRFAQRAGIDLRSLPYSFLAMEKRAAAAAGAAEPMPPAAEAGTSSRLVGEARRYKGFVKVLACQADGVRELTLLKRSSPGLFRELCKGQGPSTRRWTLRGDRIEP